MLQPRPIRGRDGDLSAHGIAERSDADVRLSEVLAGLSYALDLTEGQRAGHPVRSCLIGMRLAEVMGLSRDEGSALFYALLMKDLGCSSNAARSPTSPGSIASPKRSRW